MKFTIKNIGLSGALILSAIILTKCTKNHNNTEEAVSDTHRLPSVTMKTAEVISSGGFRHPGILNTQNSLSYIAQQVNNSSDPNNGARTAAYNYVLNFCNTWVSRNVYSSNVAVAPGTVNQAEKDFKGDALLAYATALRWAKTGDSQYSARCRQILDGWANAFRTMSVTSGQTNQVDLEASWAAPTFAAAAEIIKYYVPANQSAGAGGWTGTEDSQFITFLNRLKNQYINNTVSAGYNNNWNVSAGYALIAIGVFEDDRNVYDSGVTILKNVIPMAINSSGYQAGEVCINHQDYVHYQYTLTGLSFAANICAIQGDLSLYSASSSRLLAGFQWQAGLMQGSISPPCSPSGSKTSPIWPGIFVANRHYLTNETNYIATHYSTSSNGLPGGDLGFLSWTEYTHYNVATSIN